MNPAQNQTFLIPNDSPYDFQSAFVGGKKKSIIETFCYSCIKLTHKLTAL